MALGAIGAGIAFCLVIPFITDDSFARAVCIGTGLLMALAYLNFERLTVIVAREVLMVGFPVFKTRIELKDIRRVEVLGMKNDLDAVNKQFANELVMMHDFRYRLLYWLETRYGTELAREQAPLLPKSALEQYICKQYPEAIEELVRPAVHTG